MLPQILKPNIKLFIKRDPQHCFFECIVSTATSNHSLAHGTKLFYSLTSFLQFLHDSIIEMSIGDLPYYTSAAWSQMTASQITHFYYNSTVALFGNLFTLV